MLEVWKNLEVERGTEDDVKKVEAMMPIQGKRRYVDEETGQLVEGNTPSSPNSHLPLADKKSYFVDYDYIFADDERENNPSSFKFLQMAHAWAAKATGAAGGGFTAPTQDDDDDDSDGSDAEGGEGDRDAVMADGDDKSSVASSEDEE